MFKKILDPMLFQMRTQSKPFFEGWYFRQVSSDQHCSISVIPGISQTGTDTHAFIQTIHWTQSQPVASPHTHYHTFPRDAISYTDNPFCLKIGQNLFSRDTVELNLSDDTYSLRGRIHFSPLTGIKTSLLCPSIMGFFAYLPFLECYHGIVSMNHQVWGSLTVDADRVSFDGGKGYIEKDWGVSFPKEYIWLQSNHFPDTDASIVFSVADIPFLGRSFEGFLCNLNCLGHEYRFASYNRSKLVLQQVSEESVHVILTKGSILLELIAKATQGGVLKSPKNGGMNHTIKEGVNGTVEVRLTKSGRMLFSSTGSVCGIEVVKK